MVNKELLLKTLRYIEEHPEEWDQGHWMNPCRTKFCFAGHAALLSGVERPPAFPETDWAMYWWHVDPQTKKSSLQTVWYAGPLVRMETYAQGILGLTKSASMHLFQPTADMYFLRRFVHEIVSQPDDVPL